MIWVDRLVKELKKRELPLEWVDDMKTPSGRAHAGSLRTIILHDMVYKALVDANANAKFTYFFDDHDPMDGLPSYLDPAEWTKYMGLPLHKVPSPEPGFKNFAECYASDFMSAFEKLNCHPEIVWSSKLYNTGRMNGVIKEVLDHIDEIRKIYKTVTKKEPAEDWVPFNAICEKCGKVGTTKAYKWDGEYVHYRCVPDMVKWAKGCGHDGKVSPFDGRGKLPWKIEWAAKWKVMGITVEGAGKDHMTKGGSHDIASEICRKVLHYSIPYPFTYEFFTTGGRKMSSSKGAGISATEISNILPPEILRFLIARTPIESHLDFDPVGDTIPNLFDDYDRCMNAYFDKLENKIPEGKQGDVLSDFARIIELSQVRPLPDKRMVLPRFRTVVNLIKNRTDLKSFFEKQKGFALTDEEKEALEERTIFAEVYLKSYSGEASSTEMVDKVPADFSPIDAQKQFLLLLATKLQSKPKANREEITDIIFGALKESGQKPRDVFSAFYQIMIGANAGPKAADLILDFGIDTVIIRIKESV